MKTAVALLLSLIPTSLAQAEPVYPAPSLGWDDIQSLGTYEVTRIDFKASSTTHDGCVVSEKNRAVDQECGRRIWAVRMGGELALFVASEKSANLHSWLMLPSLAVEGRTSCIPDMSLSEARSILFCSEFCRAFQVKTPRGAKDRFVFKQDMQFSTMAWQLGGLGLVLDPMLGNGLGSNISITLGAGDPAHPATLSVQERVSSFVVMVPVSFERHYTLKRVGD